MLLCRSACVPFVVLILLGGPPCFAQSPQWIDARTWDDVRAEAQAGENEWLNFLDVSLSRVDERRAAWRVGVGEWWFRFGGIAEAWEFPESTDGWTRGTPERDWHGEEAVVWWRAEAVVPEKLGGLHVSGLPLGLRIAFRENMRVYVNGVDRGCFNHTMKRYWPVTDAAVPGERFVISCCVEGKGGPGRIEWAEWFLPEADAFTAAFDAHHEELRSWADSLRLLHDLHRTFDIRALFDRACTLTADALSAASISEARAQLEASAKTLDQLKALRAQRVPVIVKGPYVENAAPDAATIRWETDVPANSHVWYAPEGAAGGREVAEKKAVTVHEIVLTRLLPGARYSYRVGSGGVRSAIHTLQAGPPFSERAQAGPEAAEGDTGSAPSGG